MANAVYDKAREAFLNGDLDWSSDTIKVVLVDTEVENYEYEVDIVRSAPFRCDCLGVLCGLRYAEK